MSATGRHPSIGAQEVDLAPFHPPKNGGQQGPKQEVFPPTRVNKFYSAIAESVLGIRGFDPLLEDNWG